MHLGDPKTPSSSRALEMPPSLVRALRSHRSRQSAERLSAGEFWTDHGLVFASEVGTPIDPRTCAGAVARVTKRAGLGTGTPTSCAIRQSSLLSAAGVPMEEIADLLGHANSRTTAAVYRHRIGESVHGAAGPMESLLGSRHSSKRGAQ